MHLGGSRRWVPLFMVRCEDVDTPTMTSITISQEELEERICKLETEESYGARWRIYASLKYAGMSIAPSLTSVLKQSVDRLKNYLTERRQFVRINLTRIHTL